LTDFLQIIEQLVAVSLFVIGLGNSSRQMLLSTANHLF